MRILVTGGAGFIGSNFVRYWVERHPDDHVVAYDLLTYAGNRESLSDVETGSCSSRATSPTFDLAERTLRDEEVEVVVNFAAESHNSLAVVDPGRFFRTNVIGTQTLLEAARRTGLQRLPPRLDLRGLRRPAARLRRRLHRGDAVRPRRRTTPRRPAPTMPSALLRDLRAAGDDHELLEQLRAVPVPGEGDPALRHQRARRQGAAALRLDANKREWLHVLDHCRAIELVLERGEPGETYNVGSGVEKSITEIADASSSTRQARVAEDDRPRPAGPRPALPARLDEDPRAARLARRDRLGGRDRRRPSPGTRTTASGGNRSATAPATAGVGEDRPWRLERTPSRQARRPSRQCGSAGRVPLAAQDEYAGRGPGGRAPRS
jgi:dTDP-glucose 4,6-dehydratase